MTLVPYLIQLVTLLPTPFADGLMFIIITLHHLLLIATAHPNIPKGASILPLGSKLVVSVIYFRCWRCCFYLGLTSLSTSASLSQALPARQDACSS